MNLSLQNYRVDRRLWAAALLLVLTALIFPLWRGLEKSTQEADRAQLRFATLQELASRYQALPKVAAFPTSSAALFPLFNRHAEAAGLKHQVERLQPHPSTDGKRPERLEVRLTNAHQESVLRLLAALEHETMLESLLLTRTSKGLLNVDMVLAATPQP